MSRSHNPFDSDDESGSPVKSSSKVAINPFDDDENFKPQARVSKPQKVNHHNITGARNPFDDDDKDEDDDKDVVQKPLLKPQSRPSQDKGLDENDNGKKNSKAFRRAQKYKEAGATQASKIVDGGITQVHKIKETTYNTFRSNNAHSTAKKGTMDLKSGPDSAVRNELLEGTSAAKAMRPHYDDSQFQQQDLEYKSMDDLEGYALQKAEETTSSVENCLRITEEMKDSATKTLLNLHAQGEQMTKVHEITLDIDHDLSRGEKVLGTLGGMFSKTWKPKRSRPVTGPALSKNDSFKRRGHHLEQRVALGLTKSNSRGWGNRIAPSANIQQTTHDKLEVEKAKQDDALSAISNVLDDLKIMSQDMGSEIGSQSIALDNLDTDVDTLKDRVQGANYRARRLLGR